MHDLSPHPIVTTVGITAPFETYPGESYSEARGVEDVLEQLSIRFNFVPDSGLAELVARHFIGDIGSHQNTDVDPQSATDNVGNENNPVVVEVNALDKRDGLAAFAKFALDCRQKAVKELVWQDKHQDRSTAHSLKEVRNSFDVLG